MTEEKGGGPLLTCCDPSGGEGNKGREKGIRGGEKGRQEAKGGGALHT